MTDVTWLRRREPASHSYPPFSGSAGTPLKIAQVLAFQSELEPVDRNEKACRGTDHQGSRGFKGRRCHEVFAGGAERGQRHVRGRKRLREIVGFGGAARPANHRERLNRLAPPVLLASIACLAAGSFAWVLA